MHTSLPRHPLVSHTMDEMAVWHPKYIVLDSTELIRDVALSTPRMALLRAYCQRFDSEVVIPRVVRFEVENKIELLISDAARSALKTTKELSSAGARVPLLLTTIGSAKATQAAKMEFSKRLQWLGCTELPFPDVDHEQVVSRILRRRQPFGTDRPSDTGYRDFLIWHNVLSLKGPTAFVSGNSRDFAAGQAGEEQLHPDLVEDTEVSNADIKLFLGLPSLTDKIIRPRFPAIEVADLVVDYSNTKRKLEEFAEEQLADEILTQAADQYLDMMDIAFHSGRAIAGRGELSSDRMRGWIRTFVIQEVTRGIQLDDTNTVSFTCSADVGFHLRFYWRFLSEEYDRPGLGVPSNRRRGSLVAELEFTVDVNGENLLPIAVSLRSLTPQPEQSVGEL